MAKDGKLPDVKKKGLHEMFRWYLSWKLPACSRGRLQHQEHSAFSDLQPRKS